MPVHFDEDPWTRTTSKRGYPMDELISSLQKTIRRGELDLALLVARELYETSPEAEAKLWSRLCVISCEDTGDGTFTEPVILNSLFQLSNRMDRTEGDRWLYVVHAVRFLAARPKDRLSDELANITMHRMNSSERPFEIPDYAIDAHTRRGQEQGLDTMDFWKNSSHLENERDGRDHSVRDEIIALHEKGEWKG